MILCRAFTYEVIISLIQNNAYAYKPYFRYHYKISITLIVKERKLQVFVSSTYTDLIEERQAAVEAILLAGDIPAGMELFNAGNEPQMELIKRWIDESDVYLLILGARYGVIEPQSGKSYTQLEYEYAVEAGKPYFAVVLSEKFIDDKVNRQTRSILENGNNHLLAEFRKVVLSKICKICDNIDKLQLSIVNKLNELSNDTKLIGWIRGNKNVDTKPLAQEIARLSQENAELRAKLTQSNATATALYNGLAFDELKMLLEREKVKLPNAENLFEFLMTVGPSKQYIESIPGYKSVYYSEYTKVLKALNNLKIYNFDNSNSKFVATDQGHDFYIKSLSQNIDT